MLVNMKRKRLFILICVILFILFLYNGFVIIKNKRINNYTKDMTYYFRTVLENNAYMTNIPSDSVINFYVDESKKCKNDAEFLNLLIEANKSFGEAGHLYPLTPCDYFDRLYTFEYIIKKGLINQNSTLYTDLNKNEIKKVYNSVCDEFSCDKKEIKKNKLQQKTEFLDNNLKFEHIKDTLFICIKTFEIEYIEEDMQKIHQELEKFEGNRIVFDIRGNNGGSELYYISLVSMTSYDDYSYMLKTYGHGDVLTKYLKENENNLDIDIKDESIIIKDSREIKSIKEFDFDNIYILADKYTASSADSFVKFAKETNYAKVVGLDTNGSGGASMDSLTFELPNTHFIIQLEPTTTKPRKVKPDIYSYAQTLKDFYHDILIYEKNFY